MKWTSTNENVPCMGEVVCVIMQPANVVKLAYRCMPWPSTGETYWKVDTVGFVLESLGNVTHWCSLPPKPND